MPVTEESGGRLNAFAKEPKIEVINNHSSYSNGFWLLIILGGLLLTALIAFQVGFS